MKKLSQRTAAVMLSLPLALGASVLLSAPAHASSETASCVYVAPAAPAGLADTAGAETVQSMPCPPRAYVPPAPPLSPTANTYAAPPAPDVEMQPAGHGYRVLAEVYRQQADAYRQQAVMTAWFTGGFVSVCVAALAFLSLRERKRKAA